MQTTVVENATKLPPQEQTLKQTLLEQPETVEAERTGSVQEEAPSIIQRVIQARQRFEHFKIKTPDPTVQRDLQHGWMLPILLRLDEWLWQRWSYWYECCCGAGELPTTPIPRIEFLNTSHPRTRKMLEASLNCIPGHGSWQTWGNWQYVNYLFDWLLFAFGHPGHTGLPPEPSGCTGASNRLYQVMNVDALLLWPYDYWGDILGDNFYGRKQGFYATPHSICEVMTRMVFDEAKDHRLETMMDPCIGTGRFPLYASNYTLRLYGMDIDPVLCKAALVNGYLYAPWMVRPIPWIDPELAQVGREQVDDGAPDVNASSTHQTADKTAPPASVAARISDDMAQAAPSHAQGYLANTEHDAEQQPKVAPLLKRRKTKTPNDSRYMTDQRCLFSDIPD